MEMTHYPDLPKRVMCKFAIAEPGTPDNKIPDDYDPNDFDLKK